MRRRLGILAAALSLPLTVGAGLLWAYLPWITPDGPGRWKLGPKSRFAKGRAVFLRRAHAILVRTDAPGGARAPALGRALPARLATSRASRRRREVDHIGVGDGRRAREPAGIRRRRRRLSQRHRRLWPGGRPARGRRCSLRRMRRR